MKVAVVAVGVVLPLVVAVAEEEEVWMEMILMEEEVLSLMVQ